VSSRVYHSASTAAPTSRTRVLLPLCRAPSTRTTRVSAIASSTSARACRGRTRPNGDLGSARGSDSSLTLRACTRLQICRLSACKPASRCLQICRDPDCRSANRGDPSTAVTTSLCSGASPCRGAVASRSTKRRQAELKTSFGSGEPTAEVPAGPLTHLFTHLNQHERSSNNADS
jgi:hypothetical protein